MKLNIECGAWQSKVWSEKFSCVTFLAHFIKSTGSSTASGYRWKSFGKLSANEIFLDKNKSSAEYGRWCWNLFMTAKWHEYMFRNYFCIRFHWISLVFQLWKLPVVKVVCSVTNVLFLKCLELVSSIKVSDALTVSRRVFLHAHGWKTLSYELGRVESRWNVRQKQWNLLCLCEAVSTFSSMFLFYCRGKICLRFLSEITEK